MFDDAALALEEIAPEDKTRSEVLGARVTIYLAAEKWDMAAAVANHLVKWSPRVLAGGSSSAYATRRCHDNAMIESNLACYCQRKGAARRAKGMAQTRHGLDTQLQKLAVTGRHDLSAIGSCPTFRFRGRV